eukprot:CAMPEP_0197453926 /NCGR_PEP_ID=MMETSP1175-20131217/36438_1 /TAXON_ID=1003142 /ORGANISM="Triceratium dubium, Strain CCMP147" /LENGTH=115 /DNA_ID=CAMNT_0042987363 /DNA_START=34 /DNA_END=381 /DNA_ORIENTATION=-
MKSTSTKTGGAKKASTAARRKKTRKESYSLYIHRVLKQVHPDMAISKKAMKVMDDMICDVFHRIAATSKDCKGRSTLKQKEIQTAVKLTFSGTGDLEKHCVSEGTKAIGKFQASV